MEKNKIMYKALARSDTKEAIKLLKEEANHIEKRIIQENNEQRMDSLELLEEFAFRVPLEALNIVELFVDIKNEQAPKKYAKPFPREGWKHGYILEKCLEILKQKILSYNAFDRWLDVTLGFYNYKINDKEYEDVRKKARDILINMSDLDAKVVFRSTPEGQPRLVTYGFQECIFKAIKKRILSKDDRVYKLLLDMTAKLFDSEIEGNYWDHKSVQIKIWPLVCNKQIVRLRNNILNLLFNLIKKEKDNFRKITLISTLSNAMQFPMRSDYKGSLGELIARNIMRILDFYNSLNFSKTNPAVLLEIEKQIAFEKRRYDSHKNEKNSLNAAVYKKTTLLLEKLRKDSTYKLYRIVVGDDFHFFDEQVPLDKLREERGKAVDTIIDTIDIRNIKKWINDFVSIIDTYSIRQEYEFSTLRALFNKLGNKKPKVASKAIKLFLKTRLTLYGFLSDIILGMRCSDNKLANQLIKKWLSSKKYNLIAETPYTYWGVTGKVVGTEDVTILEKVFNLKLSKIQRKDLDLRFLRMIRFVYKKAPKKFDKILMAIFDRLEIEELPLFSQEIMMANHTKEIELDKWDTKKLERIISKYLKLGRLDYHDEELLAIYCVRKPLKVIDFFKKRIGAKHKKQNDLRFDPIPYHLNELAKTITKHQDYKQVLAKIVNEWIMHGNWRLKNEGQHLLFNLSPLIDDILKAELLRLIKTKNIKNILAVIDVLGAYNGKEVIDNICIEALANSKGSKDVAKAIFRVLYQTGGVWGEYGFRDTYKKTLERVKGWAKDRSKYIASFVKEFTRDMSKVIEHEEKRVIKEKILREKNIE